MRASYLNTLYRSLFTRLTPYASTPVFGLREICHRSSYRVPRFQQASFSAVIHLTRPSAAVQRQQRSERRTRLAAAEEEVSKLQCMPSIATSALRKLISNSDQLRQFASHPSILGLGQRNEVDCFGPMPSPRSAASAAPGGGTLPPSEWRGDQKSQCKRRRRDC
jgi:hypothetical protein